MKKRVLSFLLSLVMLCSLVPFTEMSAYALVQFCRHSWVYAVDYPATCTTSGMKHKVCILCGETGASAEIPPTGHSWDEWTSRTERTCTTGTAQSRWCSSCGATEMRQLPALGHAWDGGLVTKSATCTAPGILTNSCIRCNESYTEAIPALGHAWDGGLVTKYATCTAPGILTNSCIRCNESYTEAIPALGHSYSSTVTKEPTCTEDGSAELACIRCDESYTETIPALGHDFDEGVTVEPEGLTPGSITRCCRRCGETEVEALPVNTQSLFSSLRNIPPDATSDGDLTIIIEPEGGSLFDGQYTLTVMAEGGTQPYSYKWYRVNDYSSHLTDKLTVSLSMHAAGGSVDDMEGGVDLGPAYSRSSGKTVAAGSFVSKTLEGAATDYLNAAVSTVSSFQPVDEDYLQTLQDSVITPGLGDSCMDFSENPKFTATAEGYYFCRIYDAAGCHVDSDTVYVSKPVYIAVQPTNVNLRSSDTSTLYCRAAGGTPYDGDVPYRYFWYKDGVELCNGFQTAITVTEPGEYYCVAEDFTTMSATSKTVTVYEADTLWLNAEKALFEGTAGEETQISFTFGGGVAPYTFYWHYFGDLFKLPQYNKDAAEKATLMVTESGEYGLRVTDSMGETIYCTTNVLYEPLIIIEQPQGGKVLRDDEASRVKLSIAIEKPEKSPPQNYFYYTIYKDGMHEENAILVDGWPRTYYDYYAKEPGEYKIKVSTLDGRYAWSDTVTVTSNFNDPLIVEQPESVYVYPESKGEQTQYSATFTCRAISPDTGDDRYLEYYWEVSLRDTWTGQAKEWLRGPVSQNYFSCVPIVGNEVRPLYWRCVVVDTRTGVETVSNAASTVYKLAYIGVESHKPVGYYQMFYEERVRFFGGMWPCTGIAYAFLHDFNGNALRIPYCTKPLFHYDSDGSFFMKFDNFDMEELCAKVYGDGHVALVSQPTDFCAVVTDTSGNTCCSDFFNFTVTTDSYSNWDIDDLQFAD